MTTAVWAAIITSISAFAVAVVGWWIQRKQGLPSTFALTIRAELEAANASLERKAKRLEDELAQEIVDRDRFKTDCEGRIERLTVALVDRDMVINELYRRQGLPPPPMIDPRA